jgi:site-specific recombinase XerD
MWPKVPHPLPDILSVSEVERLLNAIESLKHRVLPARLRELDCR